MCDIFFLAREKIYLCFALRDKVDEMGDLLQTPQQNAGQHTQVFRALNFQSLKDVRRAVWYLIYSTNLSVSCIYQALTVFYPSTLSRHRLDFCVVSKSRSNFVAISCSEVHVSVAFYTKLRVWRLTNKVVTNAIPSEVSLQDAATICVRHVTVQTLEAFEDVFSYVVWLTKCGMWRTNCRRCYRSGSWGGVAASDCLYILYDTIILTAHIVLSLRVCFQLARDTMQHKGPVWFGFVD